MNAPGPSTTSTVSASGVEAITATLDVIPQEQSAGSIEEVYDVEGTVEELLKGQWTRVCLQFPDELLHDSVPVFKAIRSRLPDDVELYVMADTTYGSCCVDEVAAQHVDAQVVVHYGHACLSAPARLSVLYIFPKAPIDVSEAVKSLTQSIQAEKDTLQGREHLLLLCDVAYYWKLHEIYDRLVKEVKDEYTLHSSYIDTKAYLKPAPQKTGTGKSEAASKHSVSSSCCQPGECSCDAGDASSELASSGCAGAGGCQTRQVPIPLSSERPSNKTSTSSSSTSSCRSYSLPPSVSLTEDCSFIYIGPESLTLNNLLLSNAGTPIISYNPKTGKTELQSSKTNKMLMRRYGTIQKARDADVFGIVVGTLGVSSYLPTLAYLRKLIASHQKKSYTMAVGKLTPAKLGNFLEVECWVLVACGENSLVEGHKDFLRPIVTPWELEVALGEREWVTQDLDERYTLDFGKVLNGSQRRAEEEGQGENKQVLEDEGSDDPEGPVFSTVTGKYKYRRAYGSNKDIKDAEELSSQASALSIRNPNSALASVLNSAGGEHLATRSWRGLDPRYGMDTPAAMEQGRSGIAREYGGDTDAGRRDTE